MSLEPSGRGLSPAPVALFCYDRPRHMAAVVEALARNPEAPATDLFVFSDGPRDGSSEARVEQVRGLARSVDGFRCVELVERSANLGVAGSITTGVSQLLERFERLVVLEDDVLPSPHFLRYLNDALARYADDERVISAHAYCYPVLRPLPSTYFLRGADCWGWATWRRGWALYEPDASALLAELERRGLASELDFGASYPYTQLLRDSAEGRTDSWAIRWYASAFLRSKLTLYPGSSLVQNIGDDASGVHHPATDAFRHRDWGHPVVVDAIEVAESVPAREAFAEYMRSLDRSALGRVLGRLRRRLSPGSYR